MINETIGSCLPFQSQNIFFAEEIFNIPVADMEVLLSTDSGKTFLFEFTQLIQTLKLSSNVPSSMVMASTSLQALKKESLPAYSLAIHHLKRSIIPAVIRAAEPKYGLGSILLLGDILLGMASLEHRLGSLLTDSISSLSVSKKNESDRNHRPFCYGNKESCLSDTNGCSLNGDCRPMPIRTTTENEEDQEEDLCWQCVCRDGYTGISCQYEDLSIPFWIALVTIGIFIITVLFCIISFVCITNIGPFSGCHNITSTNIKRSCSFSSNVPLDSSSEEYCFENSLLLDTDRFKHD